MNRALINSARTFGLAFILMITGIVSATDIVTYYHVDQLGSPKYATDDTGALKWKEQYKPFGERRLKEADSVNPQTGMANDNGWAEKIWYTGKEEELGMDINYFGARWYDPQLGRFLARDPVGFQNGNVHSFNRYTYVNNNPYKYIDPDGEFAQLIWGGIGGAAFDAALQGIAIASGTQDEFSWGQLGKSTLVGAATGGLSLATKAVSIKRAVDARKAAKGAGKADDFFKGTKYTNKVKGQMKQNDFHAFPESVKGFQGAGKVSKLKGGDGVVRQKLEIPGGYKGKEGNFEFIKEPNSTINHRLFKPNAE